MRITAQTVNELIDQAISGDVLTGDGGGFIKVMASKNSHAVENDIPTAFEMYTLLQYFVDRLPFAAMPLHEDFAPMDLAPLIAHDEERNRLVALLPVTEDMPLGVIAHFIADRLPSAQVKSMPGILALPFVIETHEGAEHLIPEWYAAFYKDGHPGHCFPILTMRSVLNEESFSGDWVDVALNRMAVFRLPREDAQEAVVMKRQASAR